MLLNFTEFYDVIHFFSYFAKSYYHNLFTTFLKHILSNMKDIKKNIVYVTKGNDDSTGGVKLTPLPPVTSADAGKFFSVDSSGNIVLVSLSVYNGEVV